MSRDLSSRNAGQLFNMQSTLVSERKKQELSREEVADRMGVSVEVVEDFERYDIFSSLSMRVLLKYAHAVGAELSFSVV